MKRMFKSIGLNIDHPETFFVQQGRITQIVSFKPLELLEMLMECAGVALFHEIADNTKETMREKSEKLEITQQRMKLNFGPRLKLMEKERAKLAEHEALRIELNKKRAIEDRLRKYQAHKTYKLSKDHLHQCEKSLNESIQQKTIYNAQIENLKRITSSESNETKELNAELGKLKEVTESLRAGFNKTKLEREEKAREKKKKIEKLQTLREKKSEKEKAVMRSQALKESMEGLIDRLKERLANITEEKHQMGAKTDSGSDDPARPIMNRIAKLKQELLQRKDDLERTKKNINIAMDHMKNSDRSKQKHEQELKEALAEEKGLLEEEDKLKEIVGGFYLGKTNLNLRK